MTAKIQLGAEFESCGTYLVFLLSFIIIIIWEFDTLQ